MGMRGINVGMWVDLRGNTENAGNQCSNAGNRGVPLGIAVDMTQNRGQNDKLKEWRDVKIIENDHI